MPSDLAEKGTRFTLNRYQRFFNRKLTVKKPATFTDKIYHFIIAAHWQDIEIVTKMTDKINVRTYVASQIGLKYLNEVAWTSSKIDDAPLQDYACGNWILKTNHGCGGHHVIRQNRLIEIRQEIKDLLTKNYYFAAAEPQYFFIEPKAFIEKLVKSHCNKHPLMFAFGALQDQWHSSKQTMAIQSALFTIDNGKTCRSQELTESHQKIRLKGPKI